ncbi:uncharacterized protein [Palaemon carinicauda]|uniref:uncharacterized protein n=1 Tax=Palaemon carinicauda TaxID=392227 RepID=UPI0035B5FFC0
MRTCPGVPKRSCGTFMSSLETDPHALCPLCRGQRCDKENVCSLPRPASPVKPPSEIAGPSGFCQPRGGGESVASLSELGAAVKQSPVIPEVFPSDIVDAVLSAPSDVASLTLDPAASDVAEVPTLPSAQPSEGRVGPPVSPASSSPPRGGALSETPLRRTDDPDSLPRGRIRRKAHRPLRERGLPSPYQGAPTPSGEKDSGVKSLALVRAPARLRAVERRSSSPHQPSPVRQRSPTRQRSPVRQRSPTRQRPPVRRRSPARQRAGRALHLKDAPSRSSYSDARKGSPLPRTSILALPVAPARPSISERLLSLAHSRPRSPTARPSRQHAVVPAGGKEGASPTCAPIADRSARHHLRETKSSRRHLSPSHHHQRSPKRSRGHSPAPSVELSPAHSYARSPDRSCAYPPVRHSPARHSPARSYVHAPAHARHHLRPYDHPSPSRERSPTGRSPTRYRATSPAHETVFTSSPGRGTAPARVGHSDRKDPQQDAPPGRRSQDSPPRKRRITAEQGRSAERSRQSSLSFQEGFVVTTPMGREIPFYPAGIADTASVTMVPPHDQGCGPGY